jgi:hypothetical protein
MYLIMGVIVLAILSLTFLIVLWFIDHTENF